MEQVHDISKVSKGVILDLRVNPLKTRNPKRVLWQTVKTQMKYHIIMHYVAFHQSLHCLLRQIDLQRKKYNNFGGGGGIITCCPSIYTMDHPDFIVCSFMENSIGLKRVKRVVLPLPTERF